jgi:hypothetical protein
MNYLFLPKMSSLIELELIKKLIKKHKTTNISTINERFEEIMDRKMTKEEKLSLLDLDLENQAKEEEEKKERDKQEREEEKKTQGQKEDINIPVFVSTDQKSLC